MELSDSVISYPRKIRSAFFSYSNLNCHYACFKQAFFDINVIFGHKQNFNKTNLVISILTKRVIQYKQQNSLETRY